MREKNVTLFFCAVSTILRTRLGNLESVLNVDRSLLYYGRLFLAKKRVVETC